MVVFACQRDSFQKEFSTTVVSCRPSVLKTDDSKEEISCYEVVCEDTILFPEGGGQPYDLGEMNGVPVLKVLRRGTEAVHYVKQPLEEGATVKQVVDWKRRLDHMQQHSGQHLVTAIADSMLGYPTTSWWLGEDVSHIELDTNKLTQDEVDKLEEAVNEKIREALPVHATVLKDGDPALDSTRTRGLPKDHVGDVRIITIATVEANMCCGTHVSNLAELQAIKLLGFEKGKKGKTNLLFLAGGRVLAHLDKMYKRELELNLLLKNGPDSHTMLVDKLIKSNKAVNKNLQNALKDCASSEITKFKALDPKPKFFYHCRKDAEMDYCNFFIREFNDPEVLLLLAIGEGTEGHVVLHGPPTLLQDVGPRIAEILEGKGNGKGHRFQAKVKDLKALPKAVKICEAACSTAPTL
uniref:Alanyl-tRNA editing protein Aarsd1-B n=1 Tax=Lygus hesperus TaxID=30085 RepID=A0A146L2H2_LYGHE